MENMYRPDRVVSHTGLAFLLYVLYRDGLHSTKIERAKNIQTRIHQVRHTSLRELIRKRLPTSSDTDQQKEDRKDARGENNAPKT